MKITMLPIGRVAEEKAITAARRPRGNPDWSREPMRDHWAPEEETD